MTGPLARRQGRYALTIASKYFVCGFLCSSTFVRKARMSSIVWTVWCSAVSLVSSFGHLYSEAENTAPFTYLYMQRFCERVVAPKKNVYKKSKLNISERQAYSGDSRLKVHCPMLFKLNLNLPQFFREMYVSQLTSKGVRSSKLHRRFQRFLRARNSSKNL